MDFAKESVVFRNMFCASPTCSPSRGAFMTSQYAHCNGLIGLSQRGHDISVSEHHMANYWKQQGFYTVLAGVQHEKGFWRPFEAGVQAGKELGYQDNLSASDDFVKNDTDLLEWDYKNAGNVADFLLAYNKKQPFFISYGTHATHRVYPELETGDEELYNPNYVMVPDDVVNTPENRKDTAKLHKSLAAYDRCFGHVIQGLKDSGLYENTIVIYTTDHGLANPYAKCGLRDSGMAVSFIMRVPGYTESQGQVYEGLLSHIDVFPTLCRLTGTRIPDFMQGIDFSGVFTGDKMTARNEVYAEVNFHASYEPQRCIRTNRYKLIQYFDPDWNRYNLANCDDSVIKEVLMEHGILARKKEAVQLYDLLFDPGEKENLNENPAYDKIKQELNQKLGQWMTSTADHVLSYEEYHGRYKVNRKACRTASSDRREDFESVMEA